jgi:DNA-binding NarL/FixJ family response regulator
MLRLLLVEDNVKLQRALQTGLEATREVQVIEATEAGEDAVEKCASLAPDAVLMDVRLAGDMNGIETAIAIRREHPRLPVVFYSIQDDDSYYRAFLRSGILSHYAYVRKSNYLLPHSIVSLLRDALVGRSYIDPEIELRVQQVRHKDENDPLALLEPNERDVAALLAQGLTNQQIASRLGLRDKRSVSRTNGQIYAAWGLNDTTTDEKVARTRAAIIVREGRLVVWDASGVPRVMDERGEWICLTAVGAEQER